MRWLEVIRLRSVHVSASEALSVVAATLAAAAGTRELIEVRLYAHGQLPGDLAVHLLWTTDVPSTAPSPVGAAVAERLRALGLVDHSTWRELRS